MNNLDVVIIGAGPAGISAAIYLKRANINFVILEKSSLGGQIINTSIVENYPGFKNIDGATLATNMYEQLSYLDINPEYGEVLSIQKENDKYKVITDKKEYITKKIIIATGRKPRSLDIENASSFLGKGISYCATCDGYLYKNQDVAIIGAGDSAYEEANYLSNICSHIYILNRSLESRASKSLQESVKDKQNIEVLSNTKILSILTENDKLVGIKTTKGDIKVSGIFVFIGQEPNKLNIEGLNLENNYIITDQNMKTNLEGVYACGDIIKKDYYQITLAVGEGTLAALNIIKELSV